MFLENHYIKFIFYLFVDFTEVGCVVWCLMQDFYQVEFTTTISHLIITQRRLLGYYNRDFCIQFGWLCHELNHSWFDRFTNILLRGSFVKIYSLYHPTGFTLSNVSENYLHLLSLKLRVNKKFWEELIAYFYLYNTDLVENDESNNYFIVGYVFVAAVIFLPSRCLVVVVGFLPSLFPATIGEYTHRHTHTDGRDLWITHLRWS
jgi:hypothetical protein